MKVYDFDSELTEGKFKNNPKTVREAFEEDNKIIFKLIKKYGYSFSDDVLAEARIKKIVRDVTFTNVIIDRDPIKPSNKKYKKDKKSLDEILDEICDEHDHIKEDDNFIFTPLNDDLNNVEMPVDPEI